MDQRSKCKNKTTQVLEENKGELFFAEKGSFKQHSKFRGNKKKLHSLMT